MSEGTLVMVRHGQSLWNEKNIFTGWVDIPLSQKGIDEAVKAGQRIQHIEFDVIFISTLVRAEETAMIMMSQRQSERVPCIRHPEGEKLEEWGQVYDEKTSKNLIPVYTSWHLNERMYGELQGRNKDEARAEFGADQVHIWRRSYDVAPPGGESLEQTAGRTLPYFKEKIIPYLEKGQNVLISAHGNSLRSIVMELDKLSKEEVLKLEIPTGEPLPYRYKAGNFEKTQIQG